MPWDEEFGVLAEDLVADAVLAPSSHNTQPWIFRITEQGIDLLADRTRALPVNDPDDRELVMSCGAALFNLRAAAAKRGLHAEVTDASHPEHPDLLATIRFERSRGGEAPLAELAEAIPHRRTYRKTFRDREVDEAMAARLAAAAESESVTLLPVMGEELRQVVARWVSEGDAIQWSNPSWRRELAAWMHPRRKGDGLVVPALAGPVARFVVRTFDMGEGVAAKDRELADESPLLAVLGTEADQVADRLGAGQGLERVLLTATAIGLQASYLNQPVQVPALRSALADRIGPRFPQAILRFGVPKEVLEPVPRRPVDDVVER